MIEACLINICWRKYTRVTIITRKCRSCKTFNFNALIQNKSITNHRLSFRIRIQDQHHSCLLRIYFSSRRKSDHRWHDDILYRKYFQQISTKTLIRLKGNDKIFIRHIIERVKLYLFCIYVMNNCGIIYVCGVFPTTLKLANKCISNWILFAAQKWKFVKFSI